MFPKFVAGICHLDSNDQPQAVFCCTQPDCGRLFIADYRNTGSTVLQLGRVEPIYHKAVTFPDPVLEISSTFVDIYNQAMVAESQNLHQLTGIGLRKALEFLVKDYAISTKPQDEEKIKASLLGPCIEKFIADSKIKKCAKLAAWLGNDETHYVRKWVDKDINDLKLLIKLTVNWIENSILTDQYTKEMTGEESGQPKDAGDKQ
jgi:hypothetical protein